MLLRMQKGNVQDRNRLVRAMYVPPVCSYDPELEMGGHGALLNRQV